MIRAWLWLWLASVCLGRAMRLGQAGEAVDRAIVQGYRKAGRPLPGRLRGVA